MEEAFDLEALNAAFRDFVPHNRALGYTIESAVLDPPSLVMVLPWDDRFVGNPETGVIHGGLITTLLDSVSGASVYVKLKEPVPIATLDLRIDFMKPATPKRAVRARATCFKTTHNVAFVRAVAFHDDEDEPIAQGTATFMLSTKGKSVTEADLYGKKEERP